MSKLIRLWDWLLPGLIYLDPMVATTYHVSVMQAGVDLGEDRSRRPLDAARRQPQLLAATPSLGPISAADFSKQLRTRSAPASVELI